MIIGDERPEELDAKERCPECGARGVYAAIGIFWRFTCPHCGYCDGNTPAIMAEKARREGGVTDDPGEV